MYMFLARRVRLSSGRIAWETCRNQERRSLPTKGINCLVWHRRMSVIVMGANYNNWSIIGCPLVCAPVAAPSWSAMCSMIGNTTVLDPAIVTTIDSGCHKIPSRSPMILGGKSDNFYANLSYITVLQPALSSLPSPLKKRGLYVPPRHLALLPLLVLHFQIPNVHPSSLHTTTNIKKENRASF